MDESIEYYEFLLAKLLSQLGRIRTTSTVAPLYAKQAYLLVNNKEHREALIFLLEKIEEVRQ